VSSFSTADQLRGILSGMASHSYGRRVERPCDICGETYQAIASLVPRGLSRTCSKPCAIRLRALSNTRGEMRPCPVCGADFWVIPWKVTHRQTPTCSEACQAISHSRKLQARSARTEQPCADCGTPFSATPRELARGKATCSRSCSYRQRARTYPAQSNRHRVSAEHRAMMKRATTRAYRDRHRAEVNRKQSEYIKANPEIAYLAQERRRARKMAAPIRDLTQKQWRAIKAAFGNRCAYCGEHFERLTMDHVIPLSKGGSHTASNVVPACRSCNCRKATNIWVPIVLPE
jgi:5-methylcytosine-specific restriction endonuclease McrA